MSTFREGDLVEAVRGDAVIRDRVGDLEFLDVAGQSIRALKRQGFTVTLIERANPLPTEPGVYAAATSAFSLHNSRLFTLNSHGKWWEDGKPATADTMRFLSEWVAQGSLTRLEPVPDTARKVLDAVEEAMDRCDWPLSIDDSEAVLDEVKAQFGVTDE